KAAFWSEDGDDAAFRKARSEGLEAARPAAHGHRSDERRFLINDFIRCVIESRADAFVFENVASLAAPRNMPLLERIIADARHAGFATTFLHANAVEFGVAQRRHRIFVLGSRNTSPSAPAPTHSMDADSTLVGAATAGPAIRRYAGDRF